MRKIMIGVALLALASAASAQGYDERPAKVTPDRYGWNYSKRSVDIPMRDGVKLHTVILVPNGARAAPMILTRTPYNAEAQAKNNNSGDYQTALTGYDNAADVIAEGGYIRVLQDVRGMYGSGGTYVMNRPLVGNPLNPTKVDDSTDSYDTIDWLSKHVPQSNGRVGVIGISYDGYEALVPLIHPHPALKVAVPMNPMVDGWMGDDWFHNGAFRQANVDYIFGQQATRDTSEQISYGAYDVWDSFMDAVSVDGFARRHGIDQVGFYRNIVAHPAYDSFWSSQAMDRILAAQPLKVPTMLVDSLWDAEDIYGAIRVWRALDAVPANRSNLFLTIGPWYHGQGIDNGSRTGNIEWDQDTSKWWRHQVLAPFLAHYLKDQPMEVARVTAFQSGRNEWQRLDGWPPAGNGRALYLKPGGGLGFTANPGAVQTANYLSDPAHPVPYVERPTRASGYDDDHWKAWLTTDQRHAETRPDVLTFTTAPLSSPLAVSGSPMVRLTASTRGTDSDWVVKLIDVYPPEVATKPEMGGYQFAVAMDIFRGRYRQSFAKPEPLPSNVAVPYSFELPTVNHVFLPGHRIMVQVQSSWFPLYDRNPQTFVPNIFLAKATDYVAAQQKVVVAGEGQSFIELPSAR